MPNFEEDGYNLAIGTEAVAWVFPGQGSQTVGMGKELARHYPEVAHLYAEADATLGFSLSHLCWEGSDELLTRTDHAQPAILVTSLAHLAVLRQNYPEVIGNYPLFVAGHSLGEYTALVSAGALSFADAVKLVHRRGQLMNEAGKGNSGMVAVIGGDDALLEQLCAKSGAEMANYNSPGQTAISGTKAALASFTELAKSNGIKKVIPLPVSAAFHSSLMRPMAEELRKAIAQVEWVEAKIPVISNVTAKAITEAQAIREDLALQTYSPVRWVDSVRTMTASGATRFVEIGPGKVLNGLIKRIEKEVELVNSDDILK
ncbi:ACP S-malonyltransferase [Candidatus Chlorohelix sp.]|uniref:ACP S-malonyltransferase n=1 Tax=Candidatus Chlorohelix sp. TaxID=3139201 RepID=UPI00304D9E1E